MRLSLIPAYGRDYKSKREIIGSLLGGLDFVISDVRSPDDGRYINLEQIREAKFTTLNVRYSKLKKVVVLEVKDIKEDGKKRLPGWYVDVVITATKAVDTSYGPYDKKKASKLYDGRSINLDHDQFHLMLVEVK